MSVTGVRHIAVAVSDVEQALATCRAVLGAGHDAKIRELTQAGTREAHVFVGDVQFQFAQAMNPENRIARFIQEHGEGIHHICFNCDDVNAAVAQALANGAELARCEACGIVGVHEHPAGWMALLMLASSPGFIVEYMQPYSEGEQPERFRRERTI